VIPSCTPRTAPTSLQPREHSPQLELVSFHSLRSARGECAARLWGRSRGRSGNVKSRSCITHTAREDARVRGNPMGGMDF
jgi:hypothetical protein